MNQREYERSMEAVRRRNRRRRMARQRKRRRQQMIRLGITGFFCCMLCICGFALRGMLAPETPEPPAETEQQAENNQTAQPETPTPQETPLQETQETQEPDEPTTPADPDADPDSVIYLTFDDGPSNHSTEEILDILKKNNVHATFFIVNYSEDKVPLLQRMVDEGHTIGIHAYDHDYEACYSTDDAYPDGVAKLMEKVKNDVNYQPFCLRFPGGSSNTVSRKYNEGVMTRLAAKIESMGLEYYDWNVDSGDAEGNHIDESTLVSNMEDELVKGRGNIVLMHDTDAKDTTVQALQAMIDYGKENGYQFEAIDQNTPPVHHQINN